MCLKTGALLGLGHHRVLVLALNLILERVRLIVQIELWWRAGCLSDGRAWLLYVASRRGSGSCFLWVLFSQSYLDRFSHLPEIILGEIRPAQRGVMASGASVVLLGGE
jgi:hypothetical protein